MKTFFSEKPDSILYMPQENGVADIWLRKNIEPYESVEGETISTGWCADEKYIQSAHSYDEVVTNFDELFEQDSPVQPIPVSDSERLDALERAMLELMGGLE